MFLRKKKLTRKVICIICIMLFDRDVKTIGKHVANALEEELDDSDNSVVANFATTATDGKTYNEKRGISIIFDRWYRACRAGCNRFSRSRRLMRHNRHRCRAWGGSPFVRQFLSRDRPGFLHNDGGGILGR